MRVEFAQPPKDRAVVIGRNVDPADDPGEEIAIRNLYQAIEFVEFAVGQVPGFLIGETPHDQVHLAHAAMPCAEKYLPATRIEIGAGTGAATHREILGGQERPAL